MANVTLKNVVKKYDTKTIINDVSLEIQDKEFLVLVGSSGCGKSTILRMIAGLEDITDGQIFIGDKCVNNVHPKDRDIAFVFQSYALYPHMTVYENIAFPLKMRNLKKDEIDKKVKEAAEILDLTEYLNRKPKQLSGGQRQRVALGRAIVRNPKVFLMDEPLSNLDAKLRIDMRMELKRLQKELGITTLYVTHDQEEALTLSDRIAVFNNGYVEQVGTPYEIYNESKSEFVCDFIGDINRLKGELLSEVNTQSGANLDTNKTGFVRIERCISEEKAGYVKLTGKVEEAEFSGVLTKYVLECHGQELKYLEKNDGRRLYQENEQIDLYINPQDIMQF